MSITISSYQSKNLTLLTDGQGANHAETPPVIPVQVRALGISVVEKDLSVSPAVDVCHALKGVFPCFNVQLTKNTCARQTSESG